MTIRSRLTKIASSALFAIWRPKLSETVCAPNPRRVERARELVLEPVLLVDGQRLGADLEVRVAVAARRLAASLDHGVRLADLRGLRAHRLERRRLGRTEGDLRAALEVDAEVQALDRDRGDRERDDDAGEGEPDPAHPDVVEPQPARDARAGRAHQPRVVDPAEAREQDEDRARREHRGEHRERGSDQEHEREPAHARRRDREEHQAVIAVTTFASMIVAKPFL